MDTHSQPQTHADEPGWPSQMKQKPEVLGQGQGDEVKSFWCDGILWDWDPKNECFKEHVHFYRNYLWSSLYTKSLLKERVQRTGSFQYRKFDHEDLPISTATRLKSLFECLVVLDYSIRNTDRGNVSWLIKYDRLSSRGSSGIENEDVTAEKSKILKEKIREYFEDFRLLQFPYRSYFGFQETIDDVTPEKSKILKEKNSKYFGDFELLQWAFQTLLSSEETIDDVTAEKSKILKEKNSKYFGDFELPQWAFQTLLSSEETIDILETDFNRMKLFQVNFLGGTVFDNSFSILRRQSEQQKTQSLQKTTESAQHSMNETIIATNRSFLIEELSTLALVRAYTDKGITCFDGLDCTLGRQQRAEGFLTILKKNNLVDSLFDILLEQDMICVFERFNNCRNAYSADPQILRRNILNNLTNILANVDIDDVREIFIEREVLSSSIFDEIEEKYSKSGDQIYTIVIEIIKSGPRAMRTLVDVLYINQLDSLADSLLRRTANEMQKMQDNTQTDEIIRWRVAV